MDAQNEVTVNRQALQQKVGTVQTDVNTLDANFSALYQLYIQGNYAGMQTQWELTNNALQAVKADVNGPWWQPEYPPNPPMGH